LRVIARMNVGGPAQQIVGLLRDLDPARFDHYLAVGDVDDGEEDYLRLRAAELFGDARILAVPSLGRSVAPLDDLRAYRHLRRLIRELRPDVVHTHTAKAGLVGRLAALHERVPVVVHTFHGHVLSGYFNRPTTVAIKRLEARLARRSDALLSVGSRVRDELLASGIGTLAQYTVVPPGVAQPQLHQRADARRSLGLPEDGDVVGFVGRLAGVKRPDRFLDAARRIASIRPDTVFVVAGGAEPEDVSRLQAAAAGLDVRFLGWVADVGQVYAAADLLLLTSDNEGMPVSLIEAGMCGTPTVATDVGSVAEVLLDGRTGRVVATDAAAIAEAALELLADPSRRARLGEAAATYTREEFGMSRLVRTTEDTYLRLLKRS